MKKILVFDLGGTLMEYSGMPLSWTDYYKQGFEAINQYYHCDVPVSCIEKSVEILKLLNPRVCYREEEYTPEYIFAKALAHWDKSLPIQDCAYKFYEGLKLEAVLYADTIPMLEALRGKRGGDIPDLRELSEWLDEL